MKPGAEISHHPCSHFANPPFLLWRLCGGPFFVQHFVDRMKDINGDNFVRFSHFSDPFMDPMHESAAPELVSCHAQHPRSISLTHAC
jgi:hypothetical protein